MARISIGIVTIISDEHRPSKLCLKQAFGNPEIIPSVLLSDHPVLKYQLEPQKRKNGTSTNIDVYYINVGEAGQVNVSLWTKSIIEEFRLDYILLVGVAGGRADQTSHGDVVVATDAYYYELGKLLEGASQSYDKHAPRPDFRLINWAKLENERGLWPNDIPSQYRFGNSEPEVKFGPVAVGEKVIADSNHTIWRDVLSHSPKVIATEMEAYGYLSAAWTKAIPALVVRGISDLLDDKESNDYLDKERKLKATASAITFAISIIKNYSSALKKNKFAILCHGLSESDADEAQRYLESRFGSRCHILDYESGSLIVLVSCEMSVILSLSFLAYLAPIPELGGAVRCYDHSEKRISIPESTVREVNKLIHQADQISLYDRSEFFSKLQGIGIDHPQDQGLVFEKLLSLKTGVEQGDLVRVSRTTGYTKDVEELIGKMPETYSSFAKRAGVSVQTLRRFRKGENPIMGSSFLKIANALQDHGITVTVEEHFKPVRHLDARKRK